MDHLPLISQENDVLLGSMVAIVFFNVSLEDAVKLGILEGPDEQMILGRHAAMLAGIGMDDQGGEPIRFVAENGNILQINEGHAHCALHR